MSTLNKGLIYASHLDNGLPEDWFDESSLTYSFNDYGSHSSTTDRFGNSNSAIYVENRGGFQVNNRLYPYNHCTISLWIKSSIVDGNSIFFGNFNVQSQPFLSVGFTTGGKLWVILQKGVRYVEAVTTNTCTANEWHHIVVKVKDKHGVDIYINGIKESFNLSNTEITEELVDFYIGTNYRNGDYGNYVNATFDEIRIYDRPLTEFEVIALYNNYDTEFNDTGYFLNNGLVYASHLSGNGEDWTGNTTYEIIDDTVLYSTTDKNGNIDSALHFESASIHANAYVDFINFSLSIWVKSTNFLTHAYFIGNYGDANGFMVLGCHNFNNKRNIYGILQKSGIRYGEFITSSGGLIDNEWNHVVITTNYDNIKIYINGVKTEYAWGTKPSIGIGSELYYGKMSGHLLTSSTQDLYCDLDEIRLYNRTLSEEEINMLYYGYDTELDFYNTLENDLLCGYHFSDDYLDFSGNEYHLSEIDAKNITFENDMNDDIEKSILLYGNSGLKSGSMYSDIQSILTGDKYISASFWIKKDGDNESADGTIIEISDGITYNEFISISVDNRSANNKIKSNGVFNGSLYTYFESPLQTLSDNWTFCSVVINISIPKIYFFINGLYIGNSTSIYSTPKTWSNFNLIIGQTMFSSSKYKGYIDEVRIYKRELTEYEITKLFLEYDNISTGEDDPVTPTPTSSNKNNILFY